VEVQPSHGCAPLASSEETEGNILILERGQCMFAAKVRAIQCLVSTPVCNNALSSKTFCHVLARTGHALHQPELSVSTTSLAHESEVVPSVTMRLDVCRLHKTRYVCIV